MAAEADAAAPLSEKFGLESAVMGIARDLEALRAGAISVEDARVRAELAKQLLNGVRLVISAQKFLERRLPAISNAGDD